MKLFKNTMRKISSILLPVLFMIFTQSVVAQGNAEAGAKLFDANCTSCHNMKKDATGPALMGIGERAPSVDWIKKWIRNNNKLRATGEAYSNAIYKKWNGASMSAFEWMSNQQLDDVVEYITTWAPKPVGISDNALMPCIPAKKPERGTNMLLIFGVIGLALLIIVIFSGINRSLKNAAALRDGNEAKEALSFWEAIGEFAVKNKIKFGKLDKLDKLDKGFVFRVGGWFR